jgi:hypothetical protein
MLSEVIAIAEAPQIVEPLVIKKPCFSLRPNKLDNKIAEITYVTNTINIPIQHIAPSVFIQKENNKPFVFYLNQKIQEGLSNEHLQIAQNKERSNYEILIKTNLTKGLSSQKFKMVFLNYTINIYKTKTHQLIYTKNITRVKGVGLNLEKATEKAYLKAADDLENEYIDEIITAFF